MVINLTPTVFIPQSFNIGLHEDVNKGFEEIEEKPGVDHLEVGSFREVVTYVDKHRRQHEHHSNIEGDDAFEEKLLEVIRGVSDEIE